MMKSGIVIYSKTRKDLEFWAWVLSELTKQKSIDEWLTINPSEN